VEVKSSLGRAAVPNAIRDMLVREDAIGAVVLNNQIQDCVEHNGKPVLFLPHTLAHTVPHLWDLLLQGKSLKQLTKRVELGPLEPETNQV